MTGRLRPYWRDGLTMSLAVGVVGVTFGVFADAAGFDLVQIVAMSALACVGAAQFVVVGVIDSGGTEIAAVGSALLLASRYALYGPVVRRFLPSRLPGRLVAAQFVIDQSTAIVEQRLGPLVSLLPVALFSALVALMTWETAGELVLDARVVGVVAGALAAWRRASMVVVILVAVAATAGFRAIT